MKTKLKLRNPFKAKKLAKQIPRTEEQVGQVYEYKDGSLDGGNSSMRNSSIISDDDDGQSDISMTRTDSRIYREQEQNVHFSRELVRKLSISSQRSSEDLIDLKASIMRAEEARRRDEEALRKADLGEKIGKLLSVPGNEYLPLPKTLNIGSRSPGSSPGASPRNSLVYSPPSREEVYEKRTSPRNSLLYSPASREELYEKIQSAEIIKGHGKFYQQTIGKSERNFSTTNVRSTNSTLERHPSMGNLEKTKLSMPRVKKRRDSTLNRQPKTATLQFIDRILEDVDSMILELDPETSKVSKTDPKTDPVAVAKMAEGVVYDDIIDNYLPNSQGEFIF